MTARELYRRSSEMRAFVEVWVTGRECPIPLLDYLLEHDLSNPAEAVRWAIENDLCSWFGSGVHRPFLRSGQRQAIPDNCHWPKFLHLVYEGHTYAALSGGDGVNATMRRLPKTEDELDRCRNLVLNFLDSWQEESSDDRS